MNKNDKTTKDVNNTEVQADNMHHKKMIKKGGSFNIVDFLLILIVITAVSVLLMYFLPGATDRFSSKDEVEITYVLEFRGVDNSFVSNVKEGDLLYDAGQNFNMGTVKSVVADSYSALVYDSVTDTAVMKEHPQLKTLVVTVTVSAIYTEGEGYSVKGERIAVGRAYDMKTQNFIGSAYCTEIKVSTN